MSYPYSSLSVRVVAAKTKPTLPREPNYVMLFEYWNCLTTGSLSRNQEQQKHCKTKNTNSRRTREDSTKIFNKELNIAVFACIVTRGLPFFKPIQTMNYYLRQVTNPAWIAIFEMSAIMV